MGNKSRRNFSRETFDDYTPAGAQEVLDKNVDELGLFPQSAEILKNGGIVTVRDLAVRRMSQMFRIQNVGKKLCLELQRRMRVLGTDFRPEDTGDNAESVQTHSAPKRSDGARGGAVGFDKKAPRRDARDTRETRRGGDGRNPQRRDGRDDRGGNNKGPINEYAGMSMSEILYGKRQRPQPTPAERESLTPDSIIKFCRKGKWGYKDWKGNVLIQPTYDEAFAFKEGMACVECDGKVGFIDRENNLVIDCIYDTAASFSEELAVVTKDEKSGYVDKSGEIVIPLKYDIATPFSGGSAVVRLDDRWGVLSKDGNVFWR